MTNHGKGSASLRAMEATGVIPDIAALARKNAAAKEGGAGATLQRLNDAPLVTLDKIGHIQLRGDLVLVQPKQPPATTDGGVILPDSAQPRPTEGVVIAAGPGQVTQSGVTVPTGLKYGDRVRFLEESFNMRIIRGVPLLLMRDVDILGVFPDEAV